MHVFVIYFCSIVVSVVFISKILVDCKVTYKLPPGVHLCKYTFHTLSIYSSMKLYSEMLRIMLHHTVNNKVQLLYFSVKNLVLLQSYIA